ncbi:sodium/panthothenate symporter [Halolamina pelagica]|uniref:Sodium/panthothenate symporter n=1 Tax=Halolamina pelagica TaxID=699431 RepID=A0A0P7GQW1_9EURY|nr:sodium/solute symporter [Halolamina pelagica]KPN31079.1 sodium/panthothenate symporter [Halolamina pelagica]
MYGYLKTQDEDDFLVANREIGPAVGSATLSATQMSAGTFVGTIGVHYLTGVSFIYIWVGLWLGWLVSLVFVAPQMRRFGEITVPDFIAVRFGDDGAGGDRMRAFSALLIVVAYTVYISAQYTGAGLIFQSIFGVSTQVGMAIMVAIIIAYTAFGGMRASALSDFVQIIIMTVGAIIAIPILLGNVGGIGELELMLTSLNPAYIGWAFTPLEVGTIALAFGFGMLGAPYEIVRIYSMRDEQTVRYAIGTTLIFQILIATGVAVVGMSMRVLYPQLTTPDLASVIMSIDVLGPILGALVIGAVLSAMLSTVDSIMIVSGGAIAHDIYAELLNPEASESRKLWANRLAVIFVGIVPFFLALYGEALGGLVQFIVLLQAAIIGATFSMPLLLGLHWERINTPGTFAGMILGFASVLVWHFGTDAGVITGVLAQIDPVVPGVLMCLVGMVVGSYLTSEPSREALAPFFDA